MVVSLCYPAITNRFARPVGECVKEYEDLSTAVYRAEYLQGISLDWRLIFVIVAAGLAGIVAGSKVAYRLPAEKLRTLFDGISRGTVEGTAGTQCPLERE